MKDTIIRIIPALASSAVGRAIGGKGGNRRSGGIVGATFGFVAIRIARRSVPGAILVSSALVVKYLYDRSREQAQEQPPREQAQEQTLREQAREQPPRE